MQNTHTSSVRATGRVAHTLDEVMPDYIKSFKITSVNAIDGQEVFLTGGSLSEEGDDKSTLAIVLGIFVCLLFLFKKGKDSVIPAGFSFNAQVSSTMNIAA